MIKELGLCGKCNKPASEGKRTCETCRVKAKEEMRIRRSRFRLEGSRCLRCSVKTAPNVWKCARCARNVKELPLMALDCYICGESLDGRRTAVDHFVPVSKGGSHKVSNLRWAHHECNCMKRAIKFEDFVSLCVKIANHNK